MTKNTSENNEGIMGETQLNFFFWLGEEGENLKSVSEEEFNNKQETWNGQRPN